MNVGEQIFTINGIDCADCARSIEKGVASLPGVQTCSLNYTAAKLRVVGDVTAATVIVRVADLGYTASAPAPATTIESTPQGGVRGFVHFLLQRRTTMLALIGAILILPGLLFDELLPMLGWHSAWWTVSSVAALLVAGYPVARGAWRSLIINREVSINLLMTLAGIGAVIIGAYTEAGLVMVLFAIGEALEGYTIERARYAIRSMLQLAPSEATVLRACIDCQAHVGQDGYQSGACPFCGLEELRLPVAQIQVGDVMVIKPGERMAMDGLVTAGASAVNQAPITGESMPVEKAIGDPIYAGSINGEAVLTVAVTQLAADNTVSRMIRMVEEAQERRAPVQRFVDQFARYYTPAVVGIAALVATVPPLFFGAPFWNPDLNTQGWLYRALEVLVIACPCALVISTPVSLVSAISNAARNGVLIKGGAFLETLSRIKAFAFDKTGTLTAGKPSVVTVRSIDCPAQPGVCVPCDDLLALISAVERRSEHPLALAVVNAATERGLREQYPAAEAVTAIVGRGVSGYVNGRTVLIGSHAYFDQTVPHNAAQCAEIKQAAAQGHTPMLVSADTQYLGYITVADSVRTSSRDALQALQAAGVEALIMLTGDNAATAQSIAAAVGVTAFRADLLPAQKVQAIEQLRAQYGTVAMVGDGVNDTPALAAATLGIAMGAGSAQALETADITLMGNDLSKLPFAYQLSRATMRIIRQNISAALGIKALFLLIVLFGAGSLWLAVLADVGASLLVTLNGMRLLRWEDGRMKG